MLSGEILSDIPYVEFKKKRYKGTYLPNRKRLTDLENELIITGGMLIRDGHIHRAMFKMDNQ